MQKDGLTYYFHRSTEDLWKISCVEEKKDFYISRAKADESELETLFCYKKVFTPVAGESPSPVINFLEQNLDSTYPSKKIFEASPEVKSRHEG